jgi:shikimate dehydrogenase
VAVIGWPVEHSLSPPMQNAAIRALGLDWVYIALPVAPRNLGDAMTGVRALGIVGVNCTIPHKETVIPFLDEIDPVARAIGAVNTVHNKAGKLVGYNTDAYGFSASVMAEGELMFPEITTLVIGGGGVARGIAAGAAAEGAKKIILANRTRAKAEKIAADIGEAFPDCRIEVVQASASSLRNAAERSELIVNATALGMRDDDDLPLPADCIEPEHLVFDTVYAPPDTALLRTARERGARTIGGLGMLARQGAKSLSIWSGMEPDEDLMLNVLRKTAAQRAKATAKT